MKIVKESSVKIVVEFSDGENKPETLKGSSGRNLVHSNCPICGIDMYIVTYGKETHYCSLDCQYKNNRVVITCAYCGKEKTIKKSKVRKRNYCSRKCKDTDWSNLYPDGRSKVVDRNLMCAYCGKDFVGHASNAKYCSRACVGEHAKKKTVEKFLSGGYIGTSLLQETIRNFLKERVGNKCERCGWTAIHPVTGNVPLEVHHIDGNYKNNTLENIAMLCPNCHCLTKTYKSLNKGNGRAHRNK